MSAVTTGCCCGSTGCAGSCLLTSYTVSGLGGSYLGRIDTDLACGCLTNNCSFGGDVDSSSLTFTWELQFTATQIGTAVLTRYSPGCCYKATGTMQISGTYILNEKVVFVGLLGPSCDPEDPFLPEGWSNECLNSITIPFTAEVPFCYLVTCDTANSTQICTWGATGAIWKHVLQICDFPISGSEELLFPTMNGCTSGSCAGLQYEPDCILCQGCGTSPRGIVSVGGAFNWISKLKDFRFITASERGEITPCEDNTCAAAGVYEDAPVVGVGACYPYVTINTSTVFGGAPFRVIDVDEFTDDEGPDPWIPCSLETAGASFAPTIHSAWVTFSQDPDLDPCSPCGTALYESPGGEPPFCLTCGGTEIQQSMEPTYPTYS